MPGRRLHDPRRRHRRQLVAAGAAAAALLLAATGAAAWQVTGSGDAAAAGETMPAGSAPTAVVTDVVARKVTVSWTAASFGSGGAVGGYVVRRHNVLLPGTNETVLAACAGTVSALSCVETGVPTGTWQYSVQPVQGASWQGAESPRSAVVVVV